MSNILPPSELVLAELGIDSAAIKFIHPHWKRTRYRAVINWLTKYKPKPDATNLEKVRGYLEAFHHLCEVEAWEEASRILLTRLNTPTNEQLHNQLELWGIYHERASLYSRLLDKLGSRLDVQLVYGLSDSCYHLENYNKAIEGYQWCLAVARENRDQQLEGLALRGLGNAYDSLGNYAKALEYHEKCLAVSQKSGDRQLEGQALGNIGLVYRSLENYDTAIKYTQQDLEIARELQNYRSEAAALGNLAGIYCFLNRDIEALDYLNQSLAICKKIQHRRGEADVLGILGGAHFNLGDYYHSMSSTNPYINKLTQNKKLFYFNYRKLGISHQPQNHLPSHHYTKAVEYWQQSLLIYRELENDKGELGILGNLGCVYGSLGEYDKAIEYQQNSLAIAQKIHDFSEQERLLLNLCATYCALGEYEKAIAYNHQHLDIVRWRYRS
ncbi:tetratricopeptide repeat protein [Coleofasciculus sp. H7-2]|uniref:tetratricopeptide repeat protein n=1 Tax=Coleofasciculus sp. H7-2 TaxID=3351545 RepID=UPI00367201A1